MHLRSAAVLALALGLASCTALFLPTAERVPTTLELSPREISVRDQETVPLTVTVLDQHGEPFDTIPESMTLEWSLSDPALAFLKPGEVKGEKQGIGWVQVRAEKLIAVSKLTVRGVPKFLRPEGETLRQGVAARPLGNPVAVRVVDRVGTPVADVAVTFRVTVGSGSVTPAAVRTDASGVARTVWTLGPKAGENALEATTDSLKDERVRFTAVADADAVASIERLAGDAQKGPVAAVLPTDLVVRALDRNGNPVRGASVSWSATGGSLTSFGQATDEAGLARARWTLGTAARDEVATVVAGGLDARFSATAQPGPAERLAIVAGDVQSAAEFFPLPDSLAVRVSDAFDNPVKGVPVAWQVTYGGGSIGAPASPATRADGIARASWKMGVSLPNAATASAAGRTVTFRAVPRPLVPRDTLRTASGLRYLEMSLSRDTLVVDTGRMISVYFSAYRTDGFLLERLRNKTDPALRFIVGAGQVIAGFDEGVRGMRKGSIRRLFIPPSLGYGDREMEHIPPNSTLIFDVEVVEIIEIPAPSQPTSGD